MANVFFTSDHHFGHDATVTKFKREDGSPLRDFSNVDEMNEHLIQQHNKVVKPNDLVWFLGDVVMNKKHLHFVKRMNGRKKLILGNHDYFGNEVFKDAGFESLHSMRVFSGPFIGTHIPLHPDHIRGGEWGGINVHGHTHGNIVTMRVPGPDWNETRKMHDVPDPRYICVCVEQLDDYTPVSLEDLKLVVNKRKEIIRDL